MKNKWVWIIGGAVVLVVLMLLARRGGSSPYAPAMGDAGAADPNGLLQARAQGFGALVQLVAGEEAAAHELDLANIQAGTELSRAGIQAQTELDRSRIQTDAQLTVASWERDLRQYGMESERGLALAGLDVERARIAADRDTSLMSSVQQADAVKSAARAQTNRDWIAAGASVVSAAIAAYSGRKGGATGPGTTWSPTGPRLFTPGTSGSTFGRPPGVTNFQPLSYRPVRRG